MTHRNIIAMSLPQGLPGPAGTGMSASTITTITDTTIPLVRTGVSS